MLTSDASDYLLRFLFNMYDTGHNGYLLQSQVERLVGEIYGKQVANEDTTVAMMAALFQSPKKDVRRLYFLSFSIPMSCLCLLHCRKMEYCGFKNFKTEFQLVHLICYCTGRIR